MDGSESGSAGSAGSGSGSAMDVPCDEERCRRRGTPNWRCKERALKGKTLCEKHTLMELQRRKKKALQIEEQKRTEEEALDVYVPLPPEPVAGTNGGSIFAAGQAVMGHSLFAQIQPPFGNDGVVLNGGGANAPSPANFCPVDLGDEAAVASHGWPGDGSGIFGWFSRAVAGYDNWFLGSDNFWGCSDWVQSLGAGEFQGQFRDMGLGNGGLFGGVHTGAAAVCYVPHDCKGNQDYYGNLAGGDACTVESWNKIIVGEEVWVQSGEPARGNESICGNGGGNETVQLQPNGICGCQTGLVNERTGFNDSENNGLVGITGPCGSTFGVRSPNYKQCQSESWKNENLGLGDNENQIQVHDFGGKNVQGNENLPHKPRAGQPKGSTNKRPKGLKNKPVIRQSPTNEAEEVNALGDNSVPQKRGRGRPKGSKNKRIILAGKSLNKVLVHKHQSLASLCKVEEKPLEMNQHSPVGISRDSGEMQNNNGGMVASGNVHKRPRGRSRKNNSQHENSSGTQEREATEMGLGNSRLSDAGKRKEHRGLMCHQCFRSDRIHVVICSSCKKKRYCYECLAKWYPEKTRTEIEIACPFCRGNCNCRACLGEGFVVMASHLEEVDLKSRLQNLLFLLHKTLPLLNHIHREQSSELDVEGSICGFQLTEEDITKSILDDDDRVYCDNCNTSIVNFHRSCPNPDCAYDLCVSCCSELRKEYQPEENKAEYSNRSCNEKADWHNSDLKGQTFPSGKRCNREAKMALLEQECTSNTCCNTPDWRAEMTGRIPCPPRERGGCGTGTLELKRIFEANWVSNMIEKAEVLTTKYQKPDIDVSQECPLCLPMSSSVNGGKDSEVRKAAFREDNHDNFLYSPNALNLVEHEIEHFQGHWMRGEPVIVRNVLEKSSGLSWEPMVMWRAFRGAKKILKEEAFSVKAIDCFDWNESCIKVALDFVSPENVQECIRLTEEFRLLPKNHRAKEDKLEVKKMALYAASAAASEMSTLMSKLE